MIVSEAQLEKIIRRLLDPASYHEILSIAETHVAEHSDDRYPSVGVAHLLVRAAQDWLRRDGGKEAARLRADADALDAAMAVLKQDYGQWSAFERLMMVDPANEMLVDAPAGTPGPLRLHARGADRALWAMEWIAKDKRKFASDLERDSRIVSYFYCVNRLFSDLERGLPLPTPTQLNSIYKLIIGVIKDIAPAALDKIRTKSYTTRQVKDLLKTLR
ncbi:MAG TPA: hypothetical protein VGR92_06125 [Steroidobacteraceae bacterium]|nr:hypothetical protein [Steroidobacteraceae bacterium]